MNRMPPSDRKRTLNCWGRCHLRRRTLCDMWLARHVSGASHCQAATHLPDIILRYALASIVPWTLAVEFLTMRQKHLKWQATDFLPCIPDSMNCLDVTSSPPLNWQFSTARAIPQAASDQSRPTPSLRRLNFDQYSSVEIPLSPQANSR